MDYDFASDLKVVSAVAPAIYTTSQVSLSLNTANYPYKALALSMYVGVGGITFTSVNRVDFYLTHSDDDITYIPVTDDDVVLPYSATNTVALLGPTTGTVKSLVAAHATADVSVVGYRGKKQYVKVQATFGGTHSTGTTVGINWNLMHPMSAPTWQTSITDRPQI